MSGKSIGVHLVGSAPVKDAEEMCRIPPGTGRNTLQTWTTLIFIYNANRLVIATFT